MLVITRKPDQGFFIGPDIYVKVVRVNGNHVIIGIDAPRDYHILRDDIKDPEPRSFD